MGRSLETTEGDIQCALISQYAYSCARSWHSAGIDGALHLVSKMLGKGAAQSVALSLEYNWDPDGKYAPAALA